MTNIFDVCGPACPYWTSSLGELNEPACNLIKKVCSAIEKCDLRKFIAHKNEYKPIWPGTIRGYGPITKKLEGEP
jgi:hypothetical protein